MLGVLPVPPQPLCVPESDRLLLKLPGLYSAHHGARDFLEIPTGLAGFIVRFNLKPLCLTRNYSVLAMVATSNVK